MVTSPLLSFALMDSPFIHSFFSLSFLATTLYFLTFFGLCHVVTKGRDTLGDKLNSKMSPWQITPCLQFQRKVAAIHCFNKLLHVYWSLHFCENLYLHIYIYIYMHNRILLLQQVTKKSNDTEFVWLVAGTKLCCRDKDIIHKNYPLYTKRFVAVMCHRDMLLQLVALCLLTLMGVMLSIKITAHEK